MTLNDANMNMFRCHVQLKSLSGVVSAHSCISELLVLKFQLVATWEDNPYKPCSYLQFGLVWMRETRSAVEEAANGGKPTELAGQVISLTTSMITTTYHLNFTSQEEVQAAQEPAPTLDQFFHSIFTFLNGDM